MIREQFLPRLPACGRLLAKEGEVYGSSYWKSRNCHWELKRYRAT